MGEVFKVNVKGKYALVEHKHLMFRIILSFVQFILSKWIENIVRHICTVVALTQYLNMTKQRNNLHLKYEQAAAANWKEDRL